MYVFRTRELIFRKIVVTSTGPLRYVYMYGTAWFIKVWFCWNCNKR